MANKVIIGILALLVILMGGIGYYSYTLNLQVNYLGKQLTYFQTKQAARVSAISNELTTLRQETLSSLGNLEDELSETTAEIDSLLTQNEAVARAEANLKARQDSLAALQKTQREVEWEIDDVTQKLEAAQKALYSGRTGNPKELLSQQQDVEGLKSRQGQLEIKSLDLMEQLESAGKDVEDAEAGLEKTRAEKQGSNQELLRELESLKARVSGLSEERQNLIAELLRRKRR